MHVVVRWVAVVVFVGGAVRHSQLAQEPCLDEESERAVDSGSADLMARRLKVENELVGIEVFV